jgi:hypothetical protein
VHGRCAIEAIDWGAVGVVDGRLESVIGIPVGSRVGILIGLSLGLLTRTFGRLQANSITIITSSSITTIMMYDAAELGDTNNCIASSPPPSRYPQPTPRSLQEPHSRTSVSFFPGTACFSTAPSPSGCLCVD